MVSAPLPLRFLHEHAIDTKYATKFISSTSIHEPLPRYPPPLPTSRLTPVVHAPSRSLRRSPAAFALVPLLLAVAMSIPFTMRPELETDLLGSVAPAKKTADEWLASSTTSESATSATSATSTTSVTSAAVPLLPLLPPLPPPPRSSDASSPPSGTELIESIFIRGKGGRDVLDASVLLDAWRLMDEVDAIEVAGSVAGSDAGDGDAAANSTGGRVWGLRDMCVRIGVECFRLSVLDYWESAGEMTRDVMPRTTVAGSCTRCAQVACSSPTA
jgi:hypothetical protein